MAASDAQVQLYVDQRVRPRCEQIRALLHVIRDDIAAIDDVYAALTAQNPTWEDTRTDVPAPLTPADVLAWNTLINRLLSAAGDNALSAQGNFETVAVKGSVRPLQVA